jgi:NAD(P)-dependent dehydrogenase (short-subunit alcohol dehydrogenase family)
MDTLSDRNVVITGAASGIGLALAQRFAQAGARVVLGDIDKAALEQAIVDLQEKGADVAGVQTDVSSAESVEYLAEQAQAAFGNVHILCNNAGVAMSGVTWENNIAEWEWVLGVNLYGVVHGIRAFLPGMMDHGEPAAVVNTASFAGLTSQPAMGVYGVSKHAVVTMTESLYHELAAVRSNVQAHVLCPGWIKTGICGWSRLAPDEVAKSDERDSTPMCRLAEAYVENAVQEGKPPEIVADMVVEAILANRFYIITHPEWLGGVKIRMTDILEQRNPTPTSPLTG